MSREAFEKIAKESGFLHREDRGFYVKHSNGSWVGVSCSLDKFWQAATAHMQSEYMELKREQEMYYAALLESHKKEVAKLHAVIKAKDEALKIFSCPVNAGYSSDNYYEQELDDVAKKALAITPENTKLVEVGFVNHTDEHGEVIEYVSEIETQPHGTKLYAIVKDGE